MSSSSRALVAMRMPQLAGRQYISTPSEKKTPEIETFTEMVTPETAKGWLDAPRPRNREIKRRVVDAYLREILGDRFFYTAQPIIFNTRGELVDGQHRLTALHESGRTLRLLIAINQPDESCVALDEGVRRTHYDAATIGGIGAKRWDTHVINAFLRTLPHYKNNRAISHAINNQWFEELREQVQLVSASLRGGGTAAGVVSISVVGAAMLRALIHSPSCSEDIFNFGDLVSDPNSRPLYKPHEQTVRDRLKKHIASTGKTRPQVPVVYVKTALALKAFLQHKPLEKFPKVLPTKELFPISYDKLTE